MIIHEKSSITNVGVGGWLVGGAKRHTWLRGLAKAFEMLEESQAHTHTHDMDDCSSEAANDRNNTVEAVFFFSLFCSCFVVLLESASELTIMLYFFFFFLKVQKTN